MTSPHPAPRSRKKVVRVSGYGVFCKAYGGLIAFSTDMETAEKYRKHEYAQVSFARSEDEFKVRHVTITYTLPTIKISKRRRKV